MSRSTKKSIKVLTLSVLAAVSIGICGVASAEGVDAIKVIPNTPPAVGPIQEVSATDNHQRDMKAKEDWFRNHDAKDQRDMKAKEDWIRNHDVNNQKDIKAAQDREAWLRDQRLKDEKAREDWLRDHKTVDQKSHDLDRIREEQAIRDRQARQEREEYNKYKSFDEWARHHSDKQRYDHKRAEMWYLTHGSHPEIVRHDNSYRKAPIAKIRQNENRSYNKYKHDFPRFDKNVDHHDDRYRPDDRFKVGRDDRYRQDDRYRPDEHKKFKFDDQKFKKHDNKIEKKIEKREQKDRKDRDKIFNKIFK